MEDFTAIFCLPTFYREVFCCFNECKRKINISHISSANLTQLTTIVEQWVIYGVVIKSLWYFWI